MIMQLSPEKNTAAYQIKRFSPNSIQINEQSFYTSLIVTANRLIADWEPTQATEISLTSLDPIMNLKPAILLIGTGENQAQLPQDITGALLEQGIGLEVMDTAAACRTFNILTAEERNVAAALIINPQSTGIGVKG